MPVVVAHLRLHFRTVGERLPWTTLAQGRFFLQQPEVCFHQGEWLSGDEIGASAADERSPRPRHAFEHAASPP
jgi:hypothetical protein